MKTRPLQEIIKRHDPNNKVPIDNIYATYINARNDFTKVQGSCLDAPCYNTHWNNREQYAYRKVEKYLEDYNLQ